MYCPNCGKKIKNNTQNFCTYCGTKLKKIENNTPIQKQDTNQPQYFVENETQNSINNKETNSNTENITNKNNSSKIKQNQDSSYKSYILERYIKEEKERQTKIKNIKQIIKNKIFVIILLFIIFTILFLVIYNKHSYKTYTAVNESDLNAIIPTFINNSNEYIENGIRYKKETLPERFLSKSDNNTICGTDVLPETIRYDLYRLYWLIMQSPQKRIELFNKPMGMDPPIEAMLPFMDDNSSYIIGKNFCLKKTKHPEADFSDLTKVKCSDDSIKIEDMPLKNIDYFKRKDSKGTYYADYDIPKLWTFFQKQGITNLEKQYDRELKELQTYCMNRGY